MSRWEGDERVRRDGRRGGNDLMALAVLQAVYC